MAKPIKVTILGDVNDLAAKLGQGEKGVAAFAAKVGQSAKDVAKSAAGFAAAGLAAGGLGGALVESLDRDKITAALGAALDATPAEAARYGQAAGALYAKGYGENFAEVATAIEGVVSTLGRFGSQGELESVARKALDVASVFKLDLNTAINSTGILLKTGLARDANQAFDLITTGLQRVPASVRQELLEAADEYSVFFQALGFSGEEAFGVLAAAAKGGKIQLDKAGDALKEFRIRSVDMSATSVAAYKAIGLDAENMARKILAGGAGAKTAFQQILDGVLSVEDPIKREQAAVGLFGTQFEDLGNIDALAALRPMTNALRGVGGAADQLGDSLHTTAAANLEQFTRAVSTAFVDVIGGKVIPLVSELVTWVSDNFGPALSAVGSVLDSTVVPALSSLAGFLAENGTAIGVVAGLITAVFLPAMIAAGVKSTISAAKQAAAWTLTKLKASGSALAQARAAGVAVAGWVAQSAAATAHAARVVAGWVLMGTQSLIRGAQMAAAWVIAMGPVGWVIAAVVGLVALIVANWDTVVEATKAAWKWLTDLIAAAAQWIWDYFLKWTLPGLIIEHWDTIVAAVRAAVRRFLDAIEWFSQLPGRVGAWFRGVRDAAVGKLRELLEWVRGLPGSIRGALGDLGSLLLSAGRDLLSGLWRGIQNAAGWLKDKILGFFGSLLPGWARDILGIASPSRVFAAIGRWIPPGIAVGIDGNTAPALAAVGGLATAMAAELSGTDFGAPMGFALAAAGTASLVAGSGHRPSGPGEPVPPPNGGPGTAGPASTTVNVYATTNADPNRIGSEVAWAVRNTGR